MAMGFIFVLVGGILALIALVLWLRTRRFLASATETRGTVIDMQYSSSSDGGGGYSPVYQFKTADGQEIVKRDSMSSNPPRFKVGQEIRVLYEPDDPNKARINTWMTLYFVPALLGGLGLVFGAVGLYLAGSQVMKMVGL